MKYLLIVVIFSVVVTCYADMQTLLECMKKHGVQMDELKNFNHDNASKNQICMAGCAALKIDFPEEVEPTLDIFSENASDDEIEKMRDCFGSIKSTEDCKLGQELLDCEKKAKGKA